MENDRWTVDGGQTRSPSGPHSNPSVAVRGCTSAEGENHQARHQRVRSHDNAMQLGTTKEQSTSTLRTTPHGPERLDRRDEVISEALAEEVRREEQKRRRSDRAAAEVTETKSSAPEASGLTENPIEPDPNPKRRLIMKSAWTTASGSGQKRERRAIPDDYRMQIEGNSQRSTTRREQDHAGHRRQASEEELQ